MAIQKELWSGAIQENFYKGIEVIKQAFTDDTMFLMSGANGAKTIHVPSAGSLGSPTKGNSTYPVSITERPDQDVSYDLAVLPFSNVTRPLSTETTRSGQMYCDGFLS